MPKEALTRHKILASLVLQGYLTGLSGIGMSTLDACPSMSIASHVPGMLYEGM